jgi:uncharacterized protein
MSRVRIAVAVVLGLGCFGTVASVRADEPAPRVLAVQGEGEVTAPPDVAYVRIGVTAENEKAAAAQTQVNEVANKILAAAKKLKIEERDLQTVELQIGPVYANEPPQPGRDSPRIRGYQASNVVRVTVRDLAKLGAIVDAALDAGGNRVDGVEFALRDDREARKEALRRAVADAKTKAAALGEALGTKLGPVQSLREGSSVAYPSNSGNVRVFAMEAKSTPSSPGEIVVRGQVSLEYVLE